MDCNHCGQEIRRRALADYIKSKYCSIACDRASRKAFGSRGRPSLMSPIKYYEMFEVLRVAACLGSKAAKKRLRTEYYITMVWDKIKRREVYT